MRSSNNFAGLEKKVSGSIAWSSPVKEKTSLWRRSFATLLKYIRLYCEHSSLAGYKYLVEPSRTWIERLLWISVHAVTMCILLFLVYGAYKEYEDTPMVTTVDTDYYPADELEFPGVAICTINRISRQSAVKMATEVSNATDGDVTVDEVMDLIMQLGGLYESLLMTIQNHNGDHDSLLMEYYNGGQDVSRVMKRLTPQCVDTLLTCRFNGMTFSCSELFEFRKTQDGFCCTFNYARAEENEHAEAESLDGPAVIRVKDLGVERGLTVVMQPFLDDYFYTILPITGWKVTIFNPRDYPDDTSGGVTETLVSPLMETFLELDATSFYSTSNIKPYAKEKRKCIFNNEGGGLHVGYTYSDCIVACKMEAIWVACECRPFYYPAHGKMRKRRTCTTVDVPCLTKYRSKWWFVLPNEIDAKHLQSEDSINISWSLHCHDCFPSCDDAQYHVRVSTSYIEPGFYKTDLLPNVTVESQGVLHVYFSKYGTFRLKYDVAYSWSELMSNIGGICGVFIGFSLISVAEMVYFSLLLFLELWRGCAASIRNSDATAAIDPGYRSTESSARMIYWSELFPRTRGFPCEEDFRTRKRIGY